MYLQQYLECYRPETLSIQNDFWKIIISLTSRKPERGSLNGIISY